MPCLDFISSAALPSYTVTVLGIGLYHEMQVA